MYFTRDVEEKGNAKMSDSTAPVDHPSTQTIPGPGGEEVIEALTEFSTRPLVFLENSVEKYGRLSAIGMGDASTVFLHDAEDVEQVLRLDMRSYGMASLTQMLNEPLLGNSIPVTPDHLYWQQLHKIMLPMFTPKMLKQYFDRTADAIEQEVSELDALASRGDTFDMEEKIREGVFDALIRTIFTRGLDREEIPGILSRFISACTYMNARYLSLNPAYEPQNDAERQGIEDLEELNKRVYELIDYRKANRVDEPEDMLDVLLAAQLDDGLSLSDKELRDNVMALLFGGQETTPTEITWAFALLAANPEKRDRLLEEVDRVLGDRRPTFQDLDKLDYARMVFDEAMRLYPAFSFVGREALVDTEIGGYPINKGTSLAFVGWTIHRDPRWWPSPEEFIPERHTKEAMKDRPKCSIVSFGYGQRRCIGERVGRMEGTLMLAMAHQKYTFDLVDGKLPDPIVRMSIHPEGGLKVRATKRNK